MMQPAWRLASGVTETGPPSKGLACSSRGFVRVLTRPAQLKSSADLPHVA
ncbi:MAG: hypothetical protein OWQ51_04175 [Pyrobaculum arsenaticum]|uniref:Uncharacterized protein n=1 Tax=Pyrobaculum arsenaticum TaxID=121277 RepID=A0A7L4P8P4_9CREN|nr:hypothetical protein [Pyrobaculum arsenaticum]MCY0890169.1 hypothetical protein [Pyrobaculum arsenaticum]NYR15328.1 hypothetical protein [Pyrobaculum arsenaticum]